MSERFEDLSFNCFIHFLEEENKALRSMQPKTTELSKNIRKNGLPFYTLREDVKQYLCDISNPIIWWSNEISKNLYGLLIPEMYQLLSFEIDNTRKIIKEDGVDPTIAVNENPMFICWVQNRHYLIVDLLVDFFKEFVDAFDYNQLDKVLITNIFSYASSALTELFIDKYSMTTEMFLHETIFENDNDHIVDYLIKWATISGNWCKIFVNKNQRITEIIIDFWTHPLDAFEYENVGYIDDQIARFKLANYLCTRQDERAIKLVKTLPFDEILGICSNPHPDAVSYALENIKKSDTIRFQLSGLYDYMITQAMQNNHPDMVDYVIANVEKLHNILYNGKASSNTNIKMVLFLLENPEYIDTTLFVKNSSIIKREMKV